MANANLKSAQSLLATAIAANLEKAAKSAATVSSVSKRKCVAIIDLSQDDDDDDDDDDDEPAAQSLAASFKRPRVAPDTAVLETINTAPTCTLPAGTSAVTQVPSPNEHRIPDRNLESVPPERNDTALLGTDKSSPKTPDSPPTSSSVPPPAEGYAATSPIYSVPTELGAPTTPAKTPLAECYTPSSPATPACPASASPAQDCRPTSPMYHVPAELEIPSPTNPLPVSASASTNTTASQANSAHALPTPDNTPKKQPFQDYPMLADRYISNVSAAQGIAYKDTRSFTIKPAYWKRWTPGNYARFADYLRSQVDLTAFAIENRKSIEEVKYVFNSLVCDPLYSAKEASMRAEKGMQRIFEESAMHGIETRRWGKSERGEKKFDGELDGVSSGRVHIILSNGSKESMKLSELSEDDVKYLKKALMKEDQWVLWECSGKMRP